MFLRYINFKFLLLKLDGETYTMRVDDWGDWEGLVDFDSPVRIWRGTLPDHKAADVASWSLWTGDLGNASIIDRFLRPDGDTQEALGELRGCVTPLDPQLKRSEGSWDDPYDTIYSNINDCAITFVEALNDARDDDHEEITMDNIASHLLQNPGLAIALFKIYWGISEWLKDAFIKDMGEIKRKSRIFKMMYEEQQRIAIESENEDFWPRKYTAHLVSEEYSGSLKRYWE